MYVLCTDINECDSSPCKGDGTCHNTLGSFQCVCDIGCSLDPTDMVTCTSKH